MGYAGVIRLFGNRGYNERDWIASRVTNMRRVAMLAGNGFAMQHWAAVRAGASQIRAGTIPYSPWIDFVLPYYGKEPTPVLDVNEIGR